MPYGIANLSIIPLRIEPADSTELLSQVLYGEIFKVTERRKNWSKIRLVYDNFEGWIANNQYLEITETDYETLIGLPSRLSGDLLEFIQDQQNQLITIPLGSSLSALNYLNHTYDGYILEGIQSKSNIIDTAFLYRNAPYLWGGKTPFGIDSAGFTQMVYKLNGYQLSRAVEQQAKQGDALSFIEESEVGDLAFFDDNEGQIIHVGIIMPDNYIIHAHGKVRIDRLDHSGIYNVDTKMHTHKLRVIKKII
ncbi:SH3 domain-containing protein [Gelidibacter sediminis]|uniref:SH3 domain-containing protein n=1 Tax=Gelidibacter sediminis TaxID=1608710 RepID=A0A4V3F990_9FLAO|nr:NlpC/P60 family protein [Gelidibacter sediminis]TDU40186.1 SH3 domain-containing protein [Gelidibacter sediminis]